MARSFAADSSTIKRLTFGWGALLYPRVMRWGKIGAAVTVMRTLLLTLLGFGALIYAAFLFDYRAGWIAGGVLALVLEWLTRDPSEGGGERR